MGKEVTVKLSVADNFSAQLRAFASGVDNADKAGGRLRTGLAGLNQRLDEQQSRFSQNYGTLMNYTTAGLGALAAATSYSIQQAVEQQQIMAQTQNVIESTGGAAGKTAGDISSLAERLSGLTGAQDDVIQGGANMLLTFKEVKGDTFDRATAAILDMAVAMNKGSLEGIDLQGMSIQVGKAINVMAGDTAAASAAFSALSRVGVSFTEEQKKAGIEAVRLGDVLKFQSMVLSELESEFGGAAEAAGNTAAGSFAKLKNSVDNLAEGLGGKLLPTLTEAAKAAELIITWNDKVNVAYDEQASRVLETSQSYTEYVSGVTSAMVASGKLSEGNKALMDDYAALQDQYGSLNAATNEKLKADMENGKLTQYQIGLINRYGMGIDQLIMRNGLMAKTTYEAAKSADDSEDPWLRYSNALNTTTTATQAVAVTQQTLSAALRGPMEDATTGYIESQTDLNEEIQKTREELTKYQSLNGQTVVVTKEATVSEAEFALAQERAAEAAQRLAENTDPGKTLELQVAAENAAEKIDKLREGLGGSSEVTLNYNTKLGEAKDKLAELEGKAAEAAAKMQELTNQFIYQQASAGLNEKAALQLAYSLGLVDEESYLTSTAVQSLREEYDKNKDGAIDASEGAAGFAIRVGGLTDKINDLQQKYADGRISYEEYIAGLKEIAKEAGAAAEAINAIPANKDVTINYNTNGVPPPPPGGVVTDDGYVAMQHGGDMMVPPGYDDDQYRINASSGERVVVVPPGKTIAGVSNRGGRAAAGNDAAGNVTVMFEPGAIVVYGARGQDEGTLARQVAVETTTTMGARVRAYLNSGAQYIGIQ